MMRKRASEREGGREAGRQGGQEVARHCQDKETDSDTGLCSVGASALLPLAPLQVGDGDGVLVDGVRVPAHRVRQSLATPPLPLRLLPRALRVQAHGLHHTELAGRHPPASQAPRRCRDSRDDGRGKVGAGCAQ
eukprot:2235663-Rhodomonas_salina.1